MRLPFVLAVGLALATGCATTKPTTPTKERTSKRTQAKKQRVARAPVPEEAPAEDTTATTPTEDAPVVVEEPAEEGFASYYADSLAGNRTANGERYRPDDRTCAHRKHKFGTKLVVTNVDTGRSAVCRVNDRGPYVSGRVVDVSKRLAGELGMLKRGVIKVKVERAAEGAGS